MRSARDLSSIIVVLFSLAARAADSERQQLLNLDETPKQARFPITDRIWPDRPGTGHVCLWKDDKICALSVTIDDNTAPDHP